MRRGRIAAALVLLAAAAGPSRAAADEPVVAQPLEGAVVGSTIHVEGTVPDGVTDVLVNGAEAEVKEKTFTHELRAPVEGAFTVRVVFGRPGVPGTRVERRVQVDTTPPRLVVLDPATPIGVSPTAEGVVRGVVDDLHLFEVRVNGEIVKPGEGGRFEASFVLPKESDLEVVVTATDAAGNAATERRTLRRGPAMPAPPPPPEKPGVALPPPAPGVEDGLVWLATHQAADGSWESEGFGRWCGGKAPKSYSSDGSGKALYDVGVTGLAVLAFVGAGHTAASQDPRGFGRVVAAATAWLRAQQDAAGCIGARLHSHFIYNHAFGAAALVEEYAANPTPASRVAVQRALDFTFDARNPTAGWRYGVRPGENDLSVTGSCFLAIARARLVNDADARAGKPATFLLRSDAVDGTAAVVKALVEEKTGRSGYQTRGTGPARMTDLVEAFPSERSESMTALSILLSRLLGKDSKDLVLGRGSAACYALPVVWQPGGYTDLYYWHYGALGLHGMGGKAWAKWSKDLQTTLLGAQRHDGDSCEYRGSWDAVDPWAADGGRVYSTAMAILCLEDVKRSPYGLR